ncbi:MAG TPA: TIGR03564 family F420-dependent LLM class oxidoreductase [Acidimicrobiales bacterium]|jgi:F420-dependent oxidoreductase-like protein|nr:TIGR03564 family F420-dependent LLM class oxidoreductase [Acidimicrobiales bacterium]
MALRIGLSGGAANVDRMVDQVVEAEADGFTSMWYAGAIGTDPLVLLPVLGRATSTIELGTSIVQTYPRHPVLMAQQASAVAMAVGGGRFTLGIGVSHRPAIEMTYGLDYDRNAEHLREYLEVLGPMLTEGKVAFEGGEYTARAELRMRPDAPVPVVVAALASKALRSAGSLADGTITWMANRRAIESHVAPKINAAASEAGRPAPRVIVGLPVAVTDDVDAGRQAAAEQFAGYGMLPNYQRILARGGISSPADAAIVGNEAAVAAELEALAAAGATDIWAAIFPVGDDRRASRDRTKNLLRDLVAG